MKQFTKLKEVVDAISADVEKFDKGTNAAGARVRKAMMEVKNLTKEVRDEVTKVKTERTKK